MRDRLGLDESANSYLSYMQRVRRELEELRDSCQKAGFELSGVPRLLGRPHSTLAKVVDEYFWVTISQTCPPPAEKVISRWAAWY